MINQPLEVGQPHNIARFAEKRPVFVDRLPRLYELAETLFNRKFISAGPQESVIFTLGSICFEDFEEILVLGMNGYGFGCQKILRGQFERLVTMRHLHRNPADTERFLEFTKIGDYKLARSFFDAWGEYGGITAASLAAMKTASDAVKPMFERDCTVSRCDKRLPGISWSNLDLVSMARADDELKDLAGPGYYLPMTEVHATATAVLARLATDGDGITLAESNERAQRWSERAVCASHRLTLENLSTQIAQFPTVASVAEPLLDRCREDFVACWGKTAPTTE